MFNAVLANILLFLSFSFILRSFLLPEFQQFFFLSVVVSVGCTVFDFRWSAVFAGSFGIHIFLLVFQSLLSLIEWIWLRSYNQSIVIKIFFILISGRSVFIPNFVHSFIKSLLLLTLNLASATSLQKTSKWTCFQTSF